MKTVRWLTREASGTGREPEPFEVQLSTAEYAYFALIRAKALKLPAGPERSELLNEVQTFMELKHLLGAELMCAADVQAERARTDALAQVEAFEARGFSIPAAAKHDLAVGQLALDKPGSLGPEALDADAGVAARDEAMRRVDRAAPAEWKDAALDAVRDVAREKPLFTSEDVWLVVGKPPEPRALGPIMRVAMSNGWCRQTGVFVPSEIPSRHAAPVAQYESLIVRAAASA